MKKDDVILRVENVSKQYRLGMLGTGTISHDINRWWAKIRGKEDPYLKIGEANDRSSKGESQYVWALKDINFEVKRGEVLGIIGKNGAGKSTLLKLLSKVTNPTTGSIKSKGRIASLLEVGTGFHPEMTGRENIYLNGAILGMTKSEISSKIDEIINFSGCERYIDTPVKRYSSGMRVRLGFAVAAFLEPDILVVDEVLAVGDAEFQKKAIGKMQDISNEGGRTVLFVSHNLASVRQLCSRAILLENGQLNAEGSVDKILDIYINSNKGVENGQFSIKEDKKKESQILSVSLKDDSGKIKDDFYSNQNLNIEIEISHNNTSPKARLNVAIYDKLENILSVNRVKLTKKGNFTITVKIPKDYLIANNYKLGFALDIPSERVLDICSKKLFFKILNIGQKQFIDGDIENGIIKIPVEWNA